LREQNQFSRVEKYKKRRKTTRRISILVVVGSVLAVVLISTFIFGGTEKNKDNDTTEEMTENNDDHENSAKEQSDDDDEIDETEDKKRNERVETKQVQAEDDNVLEAYVGDWDPIGTEQEEPHEVVFQEDSQDWKEMEEAIQVATELEDMITHWIGNGGEQKVIGTVSSLDEADIYRVYLNWVENEGWKPTKVEKLKALDI